MARRKLGYAGTIAALVGIVKAAKTRSKNARLSDLADHLWVGLTAEQVRQSFGDPAGVERKVMATRTREIWKYGQTGQNRYALRITLDNGVVTGWDQKN